METGDGAALRGQAGEGLLDSHDAERAPLARQIVTRANQSISETSAIFDALGMSVGADPVQMQRNLETRSEGTPAAQAQREAIRKAPDGFRRALAIPEAPASKLESLEHRAARHPKAIPAAVAARPTTTDRAVDKMPQPDPG